MEFLDVVERRRMVRRFIAARSVPNAVVDRLIAAAVRAPSAGFSQGWHFLVLNDERARSAYWSATTDPKRPKDNWLTGLHTAPVLIVVLAERAAYERRYSRADKITNATPPVDLRRRWPVPYWEIDAGMAAELILLASVDAGLGACFFGVPTDRVALLRQAFEIPDGFTPVGVVAVGHPDPERPRSPSPVARRPWSDVVSYGSFGAPTS